MNRRWLLLLAILIIVAVLLAAFVLTFVKLQSNGTQPKVDDFGTDELENSQNTGDGDIQRDPCETVAEKDPCYHGIALASGDSKNCYRIVNEELRRNCLGIFENSGADDGSTGTENTQTSTGTNTQCETNQIADPFELDGTKTVGMGELSDKDTKICWARFRTSDNVYGTPDGQNIWSDKTILGSVQTNWVSLVDSDLLYNDVNGNDKYDDGEDIGKLMEEEEDIENESNGGVVYGCCVVCHVENTEYSTGHTFFVPSSITLTQEECNQMNERWKGDPYGWYGDVFWSNNTEICPTSGNSIIAIDVYKFCASFGRFPPQ